MDHRIRPDWGRRACARSVSPIAVALAITATAAALPASASAAAPLPAATLPTAALPSTATTGTTPIDITPGELAEIEVRSLGVSKERLIELIAQLPGETGSEAQLTSYVEEAFKNPGTNVGELVTSIEHELGGTESPSQLIETLLAGASSPESLAALLGDIAPVLSTEQLHAFDEVIERLLSELSPTQLEGLGSLLGGGSLSELASNLIGSLTSGNTASLQKLIEELGTLTSTTGAKLAETAGTTVEGLAKNLGVSPQTLTESTGVSSETPTKEILYVLGSPGGEGITVGVVPPTSTGVSTGTASPPSSPTTTNNYYPTAPAPTATTTTSAKKQAAKVKIVKHTVKRHVLTLVVKVPAAGKLTVTAAHLKAAHRSVGKAKKVTFKIHLTRAGAAAVARRHARDRRLTVKVKAAFKPKSGSKSTANARVRFS